MRIKVVGNITPKNLALLLMKTMAEMKVKEMNGASLYFGTGDKVIAVSAGEMAGPKVYPEKPSHKHKKKTPTDRWEPKPSIGCAKEIPADDGTVPWIQ